MRGFYKGLAPYLIHVLPNICLVLLIYEKMTTRFGEEQLQEERRLKVAERAPVPEREHSTHEFGKEDEGGDGG